MDDKTWKFCKHCVCCHTKKQGFYNLSHTSSEHVDNYCKKHSNSASSSTNPSVNLSPTSDDPTIKTSNTSHGDEFFDAQEDIPLVPSKTIVF